MEKIRITDLIASSKQKNTFLINIEEVKKSNQVYEVEVPLAEQSESDTPTKEKLPSQPSVVNYTIASSIKEVIENTLIESTGNIYMKEKKFILPIENLQNATYNEE